MGAIYRPKEVAPPRGGARAGGGLRGGLADLFKSLAVRLTRVESRKHTRFSLFSRGRARPVAKRGAATRLVGSFAGGSAARVGQSKGVATSMGTFEKYRRPRAKRSRPVAAGWITR